jgi:hypothetical protein
MLNSFRVFLQLDTTKSMQKSILELIKTPKEGKNNSLLFYVNTFPPLFEGIRGIDLKWVTYGNIKKKVFISPTRISKVKLS